MKVESFQYHNKSGWTVESFPLLDSPSTLIVIFAAPEFINKADVINELHQAYPQSQMVGCSTAGEIAGDVINDHSLSVAVVQFEKTVVRSLAQTLEKSSGYFDAGQKIAQELKHDNLRSIFVLAEGLSTQKAEADGLALVNGLNTINDTTVKITGGLAGDGTNFEKTWLIHNGEIKTGYVVAFGLYGDDVNIGHGLRGGWHNFGLERRITRSTGNTVYELDNQPALSLYQEYLGKRATELSMAGLFYPMAIRANASDTEHLVRTILSVDEHNQSLTFAAEMPTGYLAKMMRANLDQLITSSSETGESAFEMMQDSSHFKKELPILAIAVSCIGRRMLIGERADEETEALLTTLPKQTNLVGFYSYGEISPCNNGPCILQKQTMTLTLISES